MCLGLALFVNIGSILSGQGERAERARRSQEEAAGYVASITAPGTPFAALPSESYIYLLAGREPASRRYFLLPWRSSPEMQAELIRDLERQEWPPIVDTMTMQLQSFAPELIKVRDSRYRLDRAFESGIQVWVRRDSARDSRYWR